MRIVRRYVLWIAAWCLGGSVTLQAGDHFLTIGGGYSPTGNQVSLEKNVVFFQKLLAEKYSESRPHSLFFSDGDDPGRDLQFVDPDHPVPEARQLLAAIFQQTRHLGEHYRSHELSAVNGPARRSNIESWFKSEARKLTAGDRLFLYVTAHGGKSADKKNPMDTVLYLWNGDRILMSELAGLINEIPVEVPVVVVMVQCYSGGFSNLIFENGLNDKGPVKRSLCGFFATVHDRVAAGCTPDIREENYQEYSSYFWAALRGTNRLDEKVDSADYDGDGQVCFAEAHAYALLASPTIDISVQTSDAFLRHYSSFQPKSAAKPVEPTESKDAPKVEPPAGDQPKFEADDQPASPDQTPQPGTPQNCPQEADVDTATEQAPEFLTADTDYARLLQLANPIQRAVLEGLSSELELSGAERAKAARSLASKIQTDKRKVDAEQRRRSGQLKGDSSRLARELQLRWPEFSNRWNPEVELILENESEAVVNFIKQHSSYKSFDRVRNEIRAANGQQMDLDRRWTKCQRLVRMLENVALEANLPHVATPEIVERYHQLVAAERQTLSGAPAVPLTSTTAVSAAQ